MTIPSIEAARAFHECYECLAPQFGYKTRPDTKQFDPNSKNGRLMAAVMEEHFKSPAAECLARLQGEEGGER